jgi:hypothetical protein
MLAAALLFSVGCGRDEGGLRGSLGDFYDLSYDDVRARQYSSEMSIEYVTENDQVPVRVVLDVERDGLRAGTFDLVEMGDISGRARDSEIPPMTSGELKIDEVEVRDGGRIRGSFDARFRTGDDEATLAGDFDTTLEIVESIDGYTFPTDMGADLGPDASLSDGGLDR